jgi:hypothetical protein
MTVYIDCSRLQLKDAFLFVVPNTKPTVDACCYSCAGGDCEDLRLKKIPRGGKYYS